MSDVEILHDYITRGWRFVTWPGTGDAKGPTTKDWQQRTYGLTDYREGSRVGLITGYEVSPGKYLHDIDIDWAEGSEIALNFLPDTNFIFGRPSKKVSHCFYTCERAVPTFRYEDIDGSCLIEIRGAKSDGHVGFQTMAPPSEWSKGGRREFLFFVRQGEPSHHEAERLRSKTCFAAIGMILAKHLGYGGFSHGVRMAFAGYFLKTGLDHQELLTLGQAILVYCQNKDDKDILQSFESTIKKIEAGKKYSGAPTLARALGAKGAAVIRQINRWLGKDLDYIRDKAGQILKDHQGNIKRALDLMGVELSYDLFSERTLVNNEYPLDDAQLNGIWLRMDEEQRIRPTFVFYEKVIQQAARDNSFHPVKEYLDTLQWDGIPRLNQWLILCAGAVQSDYLTEVSAIVLIAAVRRVRHPGCKYDEMLVLEGEQGLNKSSALRALCPKPEWFSDDLPLNVTSQKIIEGTLGKWIVEASDLAGKRKADVEHLKAMLSRQVDGPARLAYARLPVERQRQFIIIGTTNSTAYLTDPTGARRFWPIAIRTFDVRKITELRDQLWAEAAHREAAGETIRLDEELWASATVEQEKRRELDPWESKIREACLMVIPNSDEKRRIAVDDIWDALAIETVRRDRMGGSRIADIMQRLGFRRTTVRSSDGRIQAGFVTLYADLLELQDNEKDDEIIRKNEAPF